MQKFETNIYQLTVSKQNQYRSPYSGYFVSNTDSISIFSGNFDIKTNIDFETNYLQFVSFNSLSLNLKTVKFFSIMVKLAGKAIQIH